MVGSTLLTDRPQMLTTNSSHSHSLIYVIKNISAKYFRQ